MWLQTFFFFFFKDADFFSLVFFFDIQSLGLVFVYKPKCVSLVSISILFGLDEVLASVRATLL